MKRNYSYVFIAAAAAAYIVLIYNWYEFYVTHLLKSQEISNWNDVNVTVLTMACVGAVIFAGCLFVNGVPRMKQIGLLKRILFTFVLLLLSMSWIFLLEPNALARIGVLAINLLGVLVLILISKQLN